VRDRRHLRRVVHGVVEAAAAVVVDDHVGEPGLAADALEELRRQPHVVVRIAVALPRERHRDLHHAAGSQHAERLLDGPVRIGHVLEQAVGGDAVDAPVGQRQRGHVGHQIGRVLAVEVQPDELAQLVAGDQLGDARVGERRERPELEMDGPDALGLEVRLAARLVPRRIAIGARGVHSAQEVAVGGGDVLLDPALDLRRDRGRGPGPDQLLDGVQELLTGVDLSGGHARSLGTAPVTAGPPPRPDSIEMLYSFAM
jgi:hypothetical protein